MRRVRLPKWPESQYDPADESGDVASTIFAYLVVAPFFWFVVPLLRVVAGLPLAVARALVSPARWIEAETTVPATIRITWLTRREHAASCRDEIAARLASGYADLTPAAAELIEMTKPPGLDDVFS